MIHSFGQEPPLSDGGGGGGLGGPFDEGVLLAARSEHTAVKPFCDFNPVLRKILYALNHNPGCT